MTKPTSLSYMDYLSAWASEKTSVMNIDDAWRLILDRINFRDRDTLVGEAMRWHLGGIE